MIDYLKTKGIGLKCIAARRGYAGRLRLSFGEKMYYKHPKLAHRFRGEFDFGIDTLSWRVLRNELILIGSEESEKSINSKLELIVGKSIVDMSSLNHGVRLELEGDYIFEFFHTTSESSESVEVYLNKEEKHMAYNGSQWVSGSVHDSNNNWTEEDKVKSAFSQSTTERWKQNVPKSSDKGRCGDCAYWLRTSGEYYFWDYGICANVKSDYDGKVTGIGSYCEEMRFNLK